jgi:hypothetical protein
MDAYRFSNRKGAPTLHRLEQARRYIHEDLLQQIQMLILLLLYCMQVRLRGRKREMIG